MCLGVFGYQPIKSMTILNVGNALNSVIVWVELGH